MGRLDRKRGLFGAPMAADAVAPAETVQSSSPTAVALAPSTETQFAPQRSFLDRLGLVADAFGNNHRNADMLAQRDAQEYQRYAMAQSAQQQAAQRAEDRQWQVEDREFKANQPDYFMSGNDRVRFDPATGTANVVYDGHSDAEDYAAALGLDPSTPEYGKAVQDYVLRGNGPTAFDYDRQLEGVRQGNRVALRQMPTYGQTHPRPSAPRAGGGAPRVPNTLAGAVAPLLVKMASGKPLTPAEQSALSQYQSMRGGGGRGRPSGGGGGPRTPAAPKRARGPDGRIYEAVGGQWVPAK